MSHKLPDGWREERLGNVFTTLTDYTANGSFAALKENVKVFQEPNYSLWIMAKTLKGNNFESGMSYTDKRGYDFLKKTQLFGGELLMPKTGYLGEAYIFPYLGMPATLADNVFLIVPNEEVIKEYLLHFFKSSIFKKSLLSYSYGTLQITIVKKELKMIPLCIPPIEEQRKIAEILSTVDEKISNIDQQISTTETLKKGLMQKLFTEGIGHTEFKSTEIGTLPKSWDVTKIHGILTVKYGKDQKQVVDVNGAYPILGTGGLMGYANKYLHDKPSVLIGRKGTIDKPQYLEVPFWTVDTLFYTDINSDISPKWVYYLFLTIDWRRYNEASGVPSLSVQNISNIKIPIPPKAEQQQIASILTEVENKIESLKKKKEKYTTLKTGLMQQLLTGQKRVKL